MDNVDNGVMSVFMRLTSPQILTEVIAIACAGLIALAGAQFVKAWHKRNAGVGRAEGWQTDVTEGTVIVAPYLVALIVLLIVRAILGLAKGFGLTTTAEGIENAGQLARLKADGCAEGQGYLFSKAISAAEIPALLNRKLFDSAAA